MDVKRKIILDSDMDLKKFVSVARFGSKVVFSEEYRKRVEKDRELVERWVEDGKAMYGVTTGFGILSKNAIAKEDTEKLQENIILSHSVSVGEPLTIEQIRGTMLMVLQNLGRGFSGVRMLILDKYAEFLNKGLTPWAPGEGSVGYLCPEAHIALVLIGKGKAYYEGKLYPAKLALEKAGINPVKLSAKEGLALVSGTTSATAIGALALYDFMNAAKAADVIAAMNLEIAGGLLNAFDERLMAVRPHEEQAKVASNVRKLLADSKVVEHYAGSHIQDALSIRCVPQHHGAARQMFENAKTILEIEMNSCCDNPIIWNEENSRDMISGCNADASYVGMSMDGAAIGAIGIAKMSERRNNRLIDGNLSGFPWFLIRNPGLDSGLMIPQYTQAGLLNAMRILAMPATVDNVSTCANQEDYVSMGYNACKKCVKIAGNLEYILAIELLSVYTAQQFVDSNLERSSSSRTILKEIQEHVPQIEEDMYLYPHIEYLKELIHSGKLVDMAESVAGTLN